MTTNPVHVGRLQAGITAWLDAVFPSATVLFDREYPRDAGTALVVTAGLLAPPSYAPIGGASRTPYLLPTSVAFRVTAATVGQDVSFGVAGRRWEYTVQAGDDVEAVRDALLAEVPADPMLDATIVASGTDSILVTPLSLGDVYAPRTIGAVEISAAPTQLAEVQMGDVRSHVEVQAYSLDRTPMGGAAAALARLLATSRLHTTRSIFDAHGISISGGLPAPVGLDALSGPVWASRAAISLHFAQVSLAAVALEPVERVRGTLEVRGATPDTLVTLDTEPPP